MNDIGKAKKMIKDNQTHPQHPSPSVSPVSVPQGLFLSCNLGLQMAYREGCLPEFLPRCQSSTDMQIYIVSTFFSDKCGHSQSHCFIHQRKEGLGRRCFSAVVLNMEGG